jgi:hypothetical protein
MGGRQGGQASAANRTWKRELARACTKATGMGLKNEEESDGWERLALKMGESVKENN